ncbi:TPA: NADP-dependent malic enzyme [Streptococcus pyogenes]|nr:NADP-dependent malic enzyme [Streptococcus pyogenes]HER2530816.1 NADP-dependent malic enzyme [Streptococcus pyogenes]
MKNQLGQLALEQAKTFGGKLEVQPKVDIKTKHDLSIAYTPGVASVSSAIAKDKTLAYDLTTKKNTVAVISDGTAVLGLGDIGPEAAIFNSLKLLQKSLDEVSIVVNGGGSAGLSITRKLLAAGATKVTVVDKFGIINEQEAAQLAPHHLDIAKVTNREFKSGTLEDALEGADIFIGVSAPGVLKAEWISKMAARPVIFAMANPIPEIYPDEALEAGAYIVGTDRSDFPNQINNVLAFPGIFRGALDARAKTITVEMQIAAAKGIASLVPDDALSTTNIIPDAFKEGVAEIVAKSVRSVVLKS